jgi:membrane-bound lytic murein transglycosylase B
MKMVHESGLARLCRGRMCSQSIRWFGLWLAGTLLAVPVWAQEFRAGEPPYLERAEVQAFIDGQVERGLERARLEDLIAAAEPQQRILDLISRPAEARPWYRYRPIFMTDQRVQLGRRFVEEQAEWLERAHKKYGVEPALVAAIIGVETNYGRNVGSFRVLDALVTLGFDYPPRAAFFRSELEHYLQLVEEEDLDVRATLGSYAGAMGRGQFISSSYRAYAVDFDGDGRRDLLSSWPDAIGSVANYFRAHHWRTGEPVVVEARVEGDAWRDLLGGGFVARFSLDELAEHGIVPMEAVPEDSLFSVIRLQEESGERVFLGYPNFYVITRYNRSPLYAMVVYELSQAIAQ